MAQQQFRKRRKIVPIMKKGKISRDLHFDYKDPRSLMKFMTESGAIASRELTGLPHKLQKELSLAIKRARHLALLPFVQGN